MPLWIPVWRGIFITIVEGLIDDALGKDESNGKVYLDSKILWIFTY